jgi:hypothetical protein
MYPISKSRESWVGKWNSILLCSDWLPPTASGDIHVGAALTSPRVRMPSPQCWGGGSEEVGKASELVHCPLLSLQESGAPDKSQEQKWDHTSPLSQGYQEEPLQSCHTYPPIVMTAFLGCRGKPRGIRLHSLMVIRQSPSLPCKNGITENQIYKKLK